MSEKTDVSDSDVWQISVLYDVESKSTLVLTVAKDCYTGELFEKLRQHPKAPQTDDFQLFSIGGSIRSSLADSFEERLSDYDITNRSTLALVARLPGGVWPTMAEVAAEPRLLRPAEGITLATISKEHPDVFGCVYDGPGVIMRCGHATAPIPLALYCLVQLEKGKDEIHCPKCDAKWKFALLKPAACLTPNEITEFEQRAHINYFRNHQTEMNTCPQCSTFSLPRRVEDKRVTCQNCTSRFGKRFEFCWTCLGEWKTSGNETCGNSNCGSNKGQLEILANCETKKLNGVEVPSKRACPKCSMIIDHKRGCKHMTCKYCSYEFCFICLKKYPCETDVFEPCDVAPRQTSDTNFINGSVETDENRSSSEELENDLGNDLVNDLGNDLENNLGNDLENDLENDLGNDLGNDLENDLGNDLVNDLGNDLENNLGNDLGNDLESDLGNDLGNDLENDLGNDLENDLENNLENNLGNDLGNDLENNLGNNLGNDLGNDLENDLGNDLGNDLENNLENDSENELDGQRVEESTETLSTSQPYLEIHAVTQDAEAISSDGIIVNTVADIGNRTDDAASSSDVVQPTKTLETETVLTSTYYRPTEISRPAKKSFCIIQ